MSRAHGPHPEGTDAAGPGFNFLETFLADILFTASLMAYVEAQRDHLVKMTTCPII
jgi:hypothetical protein